VGAIFKYGGFIGRIMTSEKLATLTFQDLSFSESGENVKVTLLTRYFFMIPKKELEKIGSFQVAKNAISFQASESSASKKFHFLLTKYISDLKHVLHNKDTVYIHKNSGIPLMGNTAFGIVDRGSSIIEVKPSTGCNINCTFCSVDEGHDSKRRIDIVVEKDYLLEELKKIIAFKSCKVEVHIGVHGEPLVYPKLVEFISDCALMPEVYMISMNTNGTMFTTKIIDEMVFAAKGKLRLNFSINAIKQDMATKLAGVFYPIEHVKKIAEYAVKKCEVNISPVWLYGINDSDMEDVIAFAKSIRIDETHPRICIQNFLEYKQGRNPAKEQEWESFYEKLKEWEKKFSVKLLMSPEEFHVEETKEMPKPFKKGDIIKAVVKMRGRLPKEMIAVANERCISVMVNLATVGQVTIGKEIKIKLIRDKHNIFFGVPA